MALWSIEITKTSGDPFPWKAALAAKSGKRLEVGEFLDEKEARSYAAMEWNRLTAKENPDPVDRTAPQPRPQAA